MVELVLAHSIELGLGDHRRIAPRDPDPPGDRRRCQAVIAGDDDDPDAGLMTARDGRSDLRARGIEHRDKPKQHEIALRVISACGWLIDVALGDGHHPKALAGVAVDLRLDALSLGGVQGSRPAVGVHQVATPRQHRLGGSLRVDAEAPSRSSTWTSASASDRSENALAAGNRARPR